MKKRKKLGKFINKHKNSLMIIFILLLIPTITTISRFIYQEIKDSYFNSKTFYFSSDKLGEELINYQIDNWNGVDPYNITINMNSFKNNLVSSNSDIAYDISYSCSSNISCSSSKDTGIIYATNNTDQFTINSIPNQKLNDGDSIWIEVKATSTSPYIKTLSAKFVINVGYYGLSYEISDNKNDLYLELKITNTLDYYEIKENFDNYIVGDKIDINTYLNLSEENKKKCASATITLEFDPNLLLIDMTSNAYLRANEKTTTKINDYDYINKIVFYIDAISSEYIRFYKTDIGMNYEYPNENNESIIDVTFN